MKRPNRCYEHRPGLTTTALLGVQAMARRSVSAPNRRIDLGPIIERLGEALCIVEISINSLESSEYGGAGPEVPALQCALKALNSVHAQLEEAQL
jgi:hypothetical protein